MVADVERALRARGAHFQIRHHRRALSGLQEAISLGVPADEVLKAVVLVTGQGSALAVLPARRRLDMSLLRDATGDRRVRLATETEIEHELPSWELGAVPPLGSVTHLPMYVDPSVLRHQVVTFAAGTQTESVTGPAEELFSGETVTMMPISEPAEGRWRANW